MRESLHTTWLIDRLDRLRAGDPTARDELIDFATSRFEQLAHTMLRGAFRRVGRWEGTGDVLQNAMIRLLKSLDVVTPESPLHFHRLAARHIRLELIDLSRHYFGPLGLGTHYDSAMLAGQDGEAPASPHPKADPPSPTPGPPCQAQWTELHTLVQTLPEDEAIVVDLIFYQGLSQDEAATILDVNERTVRRRWAGARRRLGKLLSGPE